MLQKSATKQKNYKTSPTVELICLHGFLLFDMNNKNTAQNTIPLQIVNFFALVKSSINRLNSTRAATLNIKYTRFLNISTLATESSWRAMTKPKHCLIYASGCPIILQCIGYKPGMK